MAIIGIDLGTSNAGTAVPYAQSEQCGSGQPYAETRWEGPTSPPDVGAPTGDARPSGSGPRGHVVDGKYKVD